MSIRPAIFGFALAAVLATSTPGLARTDAGAGSGRQAGVAARLAAGYLALWSAPNGAALRGQLRFYGPVVRFHGRVMSAHALLAEKARFVRRWPERRYTPRPGTMRVACARAGQLCTVRTLFDYAAMSPLHAKRSQGTGRLQLEISFAGRQPVIVLETSRVVQRRTG